MSIIFLKDSCCRLWCYGTNLAEAKVHLLGHGSHENFDDFKLICSCPAVYQCQKFQMSSEMFTKNNNIMNLLQ